jgi:hypothetical protein
MDEEEGVDVEEGVDAVSDLDAAAGVGQEVSQSLVLAVLAVPRSLYEDGGKRGDHSNSHHDNTCDEDNNGGSCNACGDHIYGHGLVHPQ